MQNKFIGEDISEFTEVLRKEVIEEASKMGKNQGRPGSSMTDKATMQGTPG